MGEFAAAVFSYPAMVGTFALIVVAVFWLCILVGALEHDTFDTGAGADALGLGGVPVTVSVSLLVALSWALSTTGGILLHRTDLPSSGNMAVGSGILLAAVAVSWAATRALVRPLGHLFPDEPGPSRRDLVGRTCTIRTGRVDGHFGQAEVATRDGGTALVQVRQHGTDTFEAGVTGLLYAYDDTGEFFWVAPFDAALDPGSPAA